MSQTPISIRLERAEDDLCIETLTATVFGPGMFARAAYHLREGVPHEKQLSFVAVLDNKIIGSTRLTKILWGKSSALMLGPLGVLREYKSQGAGKMLMQAAIDAAKLQSQMGGEKLILLVGDYEYYAPFGFKVIPTNKISLPRPADPNRILACELEPDCLDDFEGAVTRFAG